MTTQTDLDSYSYGGSSYNASNKKELTISSIQPLVVAGTCTVDALWTTEVQLKELDSHNFQ